MPFDAHPINLGTRVSGVGIPVVVGRPWAGDLGTPFEMLCSYKAPPRERRKGVVLYRSGALGGGVNGR